MLFRVIKSYQGRKQAAVGGEMIFRVRLLLSPLRVKSLVTLAAVLTLLASCAGDSGADNDSDGQGDSTVGNGSSSNVSYDGPVPQTSEIQNFKTFFWDPITGQGTEEDKCSSCHSQDGAAPSKFARTDDINLAFSVAASGVASNNNPLVDLDNPENSEVVIRVANGHNCWNVDLDFCRTQMITYIESWRDGSAPSATVVQLTAPALYDPSGSKDFPEDSADFAATVWPVLNSQSTSPSHCQGCHSDTAPQALRQTPYFASEDVDLAYDQAKGKIDLANPGDSRLVEKLRDEFHNCWSDCATDAATMLAAIQALSDPIPVTNIDPDLVTSKALQLFQDGIVAASGGRIEDDVIALYEFKIGSGTTVIDRSGVAPSADLTLSGDAGEYEWLSAWGMQFNGGKAQASVADSAKLQSIISATGEFTIEAWVAPANVTQDGPARIVSYSSGDNRNFMLGQTLYSYNFPLRTSESDAQGMPMLSTSDADEDLQATLQHVVVTYDSVNGRQIYVNGVHTGDNDGLTSGSLTNWNSTYPLVLGSEVDGSDPWAGTIRLLAVHSRALDEPSILANYDAGVGQKYFLLFGVSHLLNTTSDAFIIFEVSQFDNHAYLFSQPYFLSLDPAVVPETFDIEGMRLGINGKIAAAGQAYATMDVIVDASSYDPVVGQPLSSVGSVIALENGPDFDQFFLVFDRLGDHTEVFVEAEPPDPVFVGSGEASSDLAVRTFSEINHSFSQITGVPVQAVAGTYNTVVQQLPSAENINGFLSSHQMGVTQLAIGYCDALIDDPVLRTAIGIDLPEIEGVDDANAKSVADWDADFIDPMISAALNSGLAQQPASADVKDIVHHLLFTDADGINEIEPVTDPDPHGLSRCGGSCPDGRTAQAAKAACAAVLGSAGVTLH